MKKFTFINRLVCVMIISLSMSFFVSGQTNFILQSTGNIDPGFLLQADGLHNNFPFGGDAMPFYKSTESSYPCVTNHYYWDVTTIWMADYNKYYTYDSHGNILTQLYTDANTGDSMLFFTNNYDSYQRITKIIQQVWNNGTWENQNQYYNEYDDHGNQTIALQYTWMGSWIAQSGTKHIFTYVNDNITEDISQTWDAQLQLWINSTKYILTYDNNGYMTERVYQYWDINLQVWMSSFKYSYLVGASGIVYEMIGQGWDNVNSTWENNYRYTNITWHQWNGDFFTSDMESTIILDWNNGIWENFQQANWVYDSYGGYVLTVQQYFNGAWTNAAKATHSYDEHGNFILSLNEYWSNNNWVIDMGSQYLLTYDGNDLTQRIAQGWDHMLYEWYNSYKEDYSEFIYVQGIGENSPQKNDLQVYPNPASGIIFLKQDNPVSKTMSIEIMNTRGQVVYSSKIQSPGEDDVEIDLSGCAPGIYFVKMQLDRETRIGKVILK